MSAETKVQEFAQFINGEWKPGCGGATFDVLNPADGEVVAKASKATAEDVNMAVQSAKETFESGCLVEEISKGTDANYAEFCREDQGACPRAYLPRGNQYRCNGSKDWRGRHHAADSVFAADSKYVLEV